MGCLKKEHSWGLGCDLISFSVEELTDEFGDVGVLRRSQLHELGFFVFGELDVKLRRLRFLHNVDHFTSCLHAVSRDILQNMLY